ncbi:putative CCA tRNA nucleotidyltransferase 1 [Nosema granulosis]|uniref:CCA tRNA nucleotidyltransferase 1 n=1 Tax=Nosema granulosis TaxID=83296 RepID=A0A9P6L0C3_9MICR|nr:putative CCA tRNA nucleotidyltransferase 1 [Nosema granulosis]
MKIKIEGYEEEIFNKVLDCSNQYFKDANPRVAGGWVRDKIMGCSSFDLDIALDGVSGYEFAMKLQELNSQGVSSAGLVKCNPEKSKHLETAVLNIDGHFIDFVNLRKETYTSTRIPKIEFGTPFEDAHRRDLTINALFYNIKTKEIEDFTGKGIEDLFKRCIRTPLDPSTTFKDDPLRILRVFRFHSKFSFAICDEIIQALKNEDLKAQLHEKVSKERINIELFKMINYPTGHIGIFDIINNGFVECIFDQKYENTPEQALKYFSNLTSVIIQHQSPTNLNYKFITESIMDSSHSSVMLNRFPDDSSSSSVMLNNNLIASKNFETSDSSYSCVNLNFDQQSSISDTTVVLNNFDISRDQNNVSFGSQNNVSFGSQNNISFGSQNNVSFGSQNNVSFGSQSTTLNHCDEFDTIPETFKDSRWIFNIYIILNIFSKKLITVKKKQMFLNFHIVKHALVCANKISDTINNIERGLSMLERINLADYSLYNLVFVAFYLKDLWFEVLVLEIAQRKQIGGDFEEVNEFINMLKKEKIPESIIYKSPLDVSTFQKELDIEAKYITCFSAESVIYKHSHSDISNDDLMAHLKNNKEEIIERHFLNRR